MVGCCVVVNGTITWIAKVGSIVKKVESLVVIGMHGSEHTCDRSS